MTLPKQCFVLCGGLGTRLRPLTDSLPKPMAPVNGRPFLTYLIQQLREQGVERIVLLTGYLGDTIREYFGDGSRCGVAIDYSHGPAEWETARRLWEARDVMDSRFLLLYSDNYVPFSLNKLTVFHEQHGAAVSLLVQAKPKGNISLRGDGLVELYDSSRSAPGLGLVEIGYMVVERDATLSAMDDHDASFSRTLTRLAATNTLAGLLSGDPYHSISDLERLRLTEQYLAPKRILLIDRDGTINQRPPRGEYITSWGEFRWTESTVAGMRTLAHHGFRFVVLSNQAGIARGMLDAAVVDQMNRRMANELRTLGVDIIATYICPHHWDDGCECRKPGPGMFFQASSDYQLRLNRTIYIGDDPRDSLAAFNAECPCVLVGPERHGADERPERPERTAALLPELVPWIVQRFEEWEAVP